MPSTATLNIYQGDDYSATVLVKRRDGTAVDLNGYTALSQIRKAVADSDPEIIFTINVTIYPENSQIVLSIPKTETINLISGYVWDLELTSPSNITTTIVGGKIVVTKEVSRPVTAVKKVAA